jgi:hypothetical protein
LQQRSAQIELKYRYIFGAKADSRRKKIGGNELKRKNPRYPRLPVLSLSKYPRPILIQAE